MTFKKKVNKNRQAMETGILTKRAMIYQCDTCKKAWRMWLEVGLCEGGDNHKPVPFMIPCKYCDGVAYHVDFGMDIILDMPIPILHKVNYFANVDGRDCGIPNYLIKKEENDGD